ncbi:switch 2 isoform X2 [Cryptomeria japonica]|uniref:switch 2 isoform X2 n=1 Tax=Cryptomeria japonica TaxID=3369 RepID=UPI0027D9DC10|nr:switch 2 isoform X2 [Cryptomeria japonica]
MPTCVCHASYFKTSLKSHKNPEVIFFTAMSLRDLKNSLKSCTSSSSSSHCRTTLTLPSDEQRKPPKTSIKQQLAGLEQLASDLQLPTTPSAPSNDSHDVAGSKRGATDYSIAGTDDTLRSEGSNDEEEEDKEKGLILLKNEQEKDVLGEIGDSEAGVFVQPHTEGPFEPLILDDTAENGPIVQVPASINCRLLEHQREGVKFLYNLYKENHGGVLGDDMGLGKTIQTIAFLAAVLQKEPESDNFICAGVDGKKKQKLIENKKLVLIICPTSVIRNWENEFHEWGTFNIAIYHGPNRELVIGKLETTGVEIVLTSFDTFRIHGDSLCEVQWEVVIVDEAHRLKNEKSQLYKACKRVKTKKCYGLTGTIMQNKIMDLFNVFDWTTPGCLGSREHFREFYDEPLKQGQRISAPERFIQIAEERKQHLLCVLQKYLLRRTKGETIGHLMRGKEDNVVFCAMSPLQRRVYKRLLESADFQSLISKDLPCSCGSRLTRVECCHKTVPDGIIWSYLHRDNPDGCDSCPFCLVLPCLVKLQQVSNHLELIKPNTKDDPEKQKKDEALAVAVFEKDAELIGGIAPDESFMGLSDAQHCGKMRALEKLMTSWILQGDKVLLFSYSVRMLDILEKFLIRKGYCFSRLDGSIPMSARQSLVDNFNNSPSKQVFLISTRAGGLGLNLVSANRVVIFDPNWNPSQDLQAQDRSFRYGQKKHVTVFRLLAAGSLEELIYTRQIYKQQLFNIAVSGSLEKRYFEGVQDSKEYKGELFGISNLFRDLSDKHFTSDIVEQHEKRLQGFEHHNHVAKGQLAVRAVDQKMGIIANINSIVSVENKETDPPVCGQKDGKENEKILGKGSQCKNLPKLADVLTDAGVIYAHRNEEVVNIGAHNLENTVEDKHLKQTEKGGYVSERGNHSRISSENIHHKPTRSKRQPDMANQKGKVKKKHTISGKIGGISAENMDKTKQYRLMAQFASMTELQFSKWLLSASPPERDKFLADFKLWMQSNKR